MEGDDRDANGEAPSGFLAEISKFRKGGLKPTETVHSAGPQSLDNIVVPKANVRVFDDKTEYYDAPADFRQKVKQVAQLVRDSKHTVVYTGAGISTNARLPDYRGPKGIWTLKEQGLTPDTVAPNGEIDPTHGHLALTALNKAGLVKHVVSTNIDGLHMRSGLPVSCLSELHGNAYTEKCTKCGYVQIRQITFELIQNGVHPDHLTGNTCSRPDCGGKLRDCIVKFGESLPAEELERATAESKSADISIVIGTSMRVKPACELPLMTLENGGKLIIVNLQRTPFDKKASVQIHGDCDDFLMLLAKELDVSVPNTTPEGRELVDFFDDIDYRYAQEVERLKKKQAEYDKKMQVFGTQKVDNTVISTKDVASGEIVDAKNLLLFSGCNNCAYTVASKCTKVILENCIGLKIKFPQTILTQTMEIVNCKDVILDISVPVFTVSVDKSQDVSVVFSAPRFFQTFYVANVKNITLTVTPVDPVVLTSDELCERFAESKKMEFPQFVVQNVGGVLTTELVIREGGGYATTKRQKDIADENDRRNIQAMENAMRRLVTISGRPAIGK